MEREKKLKDKDYGHPEPGEAPVLNNLWNEGTYFLKLLNFICNQQYNKFKF